MIKKDLSNYRGTTKSCLPLQLTMWNLLLALMISGSKNLVEAIDSRTSNTVNNYHGFPPSPFQPSHTNAISIHHQQQQQQQQRHHHSSQDIRSQVNRFREDINRIKYLPKTNLTTPCPLISKDSSSTRAWTLEDWDVHCTHSLARYINHFKIWPKSTTAKNILPTVGVVTTWSLLVVSIANKLLPQNRPPAKFTVTLSFFQAPIVLLLTLRTNRALDRLLEARRSWGVLLRSTRSLMGLISSYILPTHPEISLLMGRYLAIFGWTLKGMIRGERVKDLIRIVLKRGFKEEVEWIEHIQKTTTVKTPNILIFRIRYLLSIIAKDISAPIPPVVILRMEEIIHQMETTVGVCNRIIISPIPPTYTRHTSRVLSLYLALLPFALVGLDASRKVILLTTVFASYVLVGIDEIGLEIEQPFPLMPLQAMARTIQSEVEKQVVMTTTLPPLWNED